ncbi:phage major capsid protein, P2 family [Thiothrix nivea]|uniref:Phage major capsid protein, P2 family n=1 Tax=Thiothrix nivea (strain ATCC 35100 / DSM 5205 / JP2) TaxID=870187 RepID=A0A656HH13_THINJ|nr:phage major capsid protein, P2 family [Thiothrix nivea]EIJ35717.1 phage major capsid protein, P2 family [Thiothrix nivea DSM 5205]
MQSNTRLCFNRYLAEVATANRLDKATGEAFNYSPEAQQSFYKMVGEKADFLKRINQITVTAQLGQKIGLGVSRPIASRTNTDESERQTRYVGELDGDTYHCQQTNYDTHLKYSLMDSWAHLDDFGTIYASQIAKQVARDRLMIGWRGENAAAETDVTTNTLLQDVNEGWTTKVRKKQPHRFMGYGSDGNPTEDTYTVGDGSKYGTLDALVFDMTVNLLDAWHQEADDLVVMVGREIWVAHGLALLANTSLPTERNALQTWFASKTVAGLPCIMPPYLPSRAVIVTSYDNLSIYHQTGTLRRTIIDNPKRDRVEEYLSENEAYVVEDFGKFAGVRHGAILLPDGAGGWA